MRCARMKSMYMKPFIPNKGVILAASIWRILIVTPIPLGIIDADAMEGLLMNCRAPCGHNCWWCDSVCYCFSLPTSLPRCARVLNSWLPLLPSLNHLHEQETEHWFIVRARTPRYLPTTIQQKSFSHEILQNFMLFNVGGCNRVDELKFCATRSVAQKRRVELIDVEAWEQHRNKVENRFTQTLEVILNT